MTDSATGDTETKPGDPPEKKLKISLAYSGLIYLPVYVAKELGFFQEQGLDVELVLSNGDDNAVSQVMHSKNQIPDASGKIHYSDVAICDPFSIAHKISDKKSDPYKNPEEAVIIGCMIDKPPVWIYRSYDLKDGANTKKFEDIKDSLPNSDGEIRSLDDIDFKKVTKVHCYPSPNTGFLFGIDLISRGLQKDRTPINIKTLDFDPLNCVEGENNELILTSNIVKIAYDYYLFQKDSNKHPRKVIYTYSTGELDDKLKSFFFTGILANKKTTLDKEAELIGFLIGVKKAIRKISEGDFTAEERTKVYTLLTEKIKTYSHLDSATKSDNNALEEIAKLILEFSSECNFYSENLLIEPKLYNATLAKRKEIIKNQEDLNYYKYVMLDFVYNMNKKQLSFWQKRKYQFQSIVFKIYKTGFGQHLNFTKKYHPEVFSYSVVILLIGVSIILLNYFSTKDYLDYAFGFAGLFVCVWCFKKTKSLYRVYKKQKKLLDFPKLFLTIVYTVYISAIGGKLLANYFAHKPASGKEYIIIIKGADTVHSNKTDTSKTIIIK